MKEVLAYHL